MSNIQIGSLTDNYFYIDFTGKTDPKNAYSFSIPTTGSTRISAEGFTGDIKMELQDKNGKVIKSIATSNTNSATLSVDNLGAADYILNVSPVSSDTNYQVSLTSNGKVDPITKLKVDSGFFTPDQKGQVGVDFLHDGGGYQGEAAIFSVDGMENLTPGSQEFIKEAARRALTDSVLGHIVIADSTEGGNPLFRGGLGEQDFNNGQYKGVKKFAMTPGKAFAVMLVPNGKVQDVFNNPDIGGAKRPLFSLSSSNPNEAWLYGQAKQAADLTGDGKAFAIEDQRADGESDGDYNDIIFNLTGATGKAVSVKDVINPDKDWTTSEIGKKLFDYVESKLPIPEPLIETKPPVVTPTVETKPPIVTPPVATTPTVETKPPVATTPTVETKPPVETPPVATTPTVETKPPVETPTVETKPPVETPPVATTPTVETKPPVVTPTVETKPPVETPPVATTPTVETKPPVATTPTVETKPPVATAPTVETKPPVATTPTVETKPPVETAPVATTPTVETQPPVVTTPTVEETKPTIDPMPIIGIIDKGFEENNPDLDNSKVTLGRDRVDKDSNPYLSADEGDQHGTFTWGLISAIQGNDLGIDGINDQSPVYLSRAIGSGEWDLALNDFVSEAKAQKKKNAIANLSLDLTQKNADGTITTRYEFTPRERAALENARQNGVLIVVAAGNDGGVMSVLGQSSQEFENIITIGSSGGFGRADYSSYGYGLDLLVPGGTIDNPTLSTVGDDVGTMAGTSVAAAKATGMASVVWAANPDLNVTQVIDVLTGSAIDLKEPGWDEETGFGVLNFKGAIDLAKETVTQSYTPSAFITPNTWDGEGKVTPMERALQNWSQVNTSGRTFYHGWLDNSNPSDVYTFTVNQPTPLQFGTVNLDTQQGSAILTGNGVYLRSGDQPANANTLPGGLLPAGTYNLTVSKGTLSQVDSYTLKMNFYPNANGSEPYSEVNLPPKPTPAPTPDPIVNPTQVVGEFAKEYLKIGGENSRIGKAIKNQVEQVSGVITQLFENGSMLWNGTKVATIEFGGAKTIESLVKAAASFPSSIPNPSVDTSKNWKAEVYNWERGSELKPSGKLSKATPQSNFLGSFSLGSNSNNALKFDWSGSPNGESKFHPDNFVIKAFTDRDFEANKTYTFSAKGDDGFRLFARPINKPDAWELITPITDTSINPDTRPWWQENYGDPRKEYKFTPKEGGQYRVVALLYDRGGAANFDLSWKEVAPPVSSSKTYQLPYPDGDKYEVTEGNSGHHASGDNVQYNRYAWDFGMPEGSTVVATRDGKVISLYEGSNTNLKDSKGWLKYTNYVVIDHGDGTSSLYAHLKQDSVIPKVGDQVKQNQPIAQSGNTGHSTGPHLHYSLEKTPSGKNYENSSSGYWTDSLPSSFIDPDVLKQNPNGVPTTNRFYTS